jgi:hypothetical protein
MVETRTGRVLVLLLFPPIIPVLSSAYVMCCIGSGKRWIHAVRFRSFCSKKSALESFGYGGAGPAGRSNVHTFLSSLCPLISFPTLRISPILFSFQRLAFVLASCFQFRFSRCIWAIQRPMRGDELVQGLCLLRNLRFGFTPAPPRWMRGDPA